jgi:hypothetical protein
MPNMTVKNCEGQSGGLAMFWKREINLVTGLKSRYHIDSCIMDANGFQRRFTGIYGEPARDKKWKTWKLLRILSQQSNLPWLCLGDFNEILYNHEKKGGPPPEHNTR